MRIQIGDAIKRALKQVVQNQVQTRSGLFVPPDYIRGRHFGGFHGYAGWIQDCIRACCQGVRGVGPDELSELTAVAMWQEPHVGVMWVVHKHADAMAVLEQLGARVADATGRGGLTDKFQKQVREADKLRERGTLLVVALNPVEAERSATGDLPASVSAWNPASVEEAQAVPEQKFRLSM
jgi:hypothetical protein